VKVIPKGDFQRPALCDQFDETWIDSQKSRVARKKNVNKQNACMDDAIFPSYLGMYDTIITTINNNKIPMIVDKAQQSIIISQK
jgi:hypothetical protein